MIVPLPHRLSTAEVYAEADRLGVRENRLEVEAKLPDLWSELVAGCACPSGCWSTSSSRRRVSLCPEIGTALEAVRDAGADHVFVSGSGPTVAGLFWASPASAAGEGHMRAEAAATALEPRYPGACCAVPVLRDFGFPLFA